MDPRTLENLRKVAIEAGVVDPDVVNIIPSATIAQLEAGQISSTDAIAILRRSKPAFFDARRMGRNYRQLRSETLAAARAAERSTPISLPVAETKVSAMEGKRYKQFKRESLNALKGR